MKKEPAPVGGVVKDPTFVAESKKSQTKSGWCPSRLHVRGPHGENQTPRNSKGSQTTGEPGKEDIRSENL